MTMKKPTEQWIRRREKREARILKHGGYGLAGLSHTQLVRPKGLKGLNSYGPAGPVRTLTEAERKEIERLMKQDGKL